MMSVLNEYNSQKFGYGDVVLYSFNPKVDKSVLDAMLHKTKNPASIFTDIDDIYAVNYSIFVMFMQLLDQV